MSWDSYIDSMYRDCESINAAGIYGLDGSTWAERRLTINAQDLANIKTGFCPPGSNCPLFANGLKLHTQADNSVIKKYVVLRTEEGCIQARGSDAEGLCIAKTTQAIIIAHFQGEHAAGNVRKIVEKIQEYLVDQNL